MPGLLSLALNLYLIDFHALAFSPEAFSVFLLFGASGILVICCYFKCVKFPYNKSHTRWICVRRDGKKPGI